MPLLETELTRLRAYVFDLDGVIWRGETAIEGAVECVRALQNAGRACLFASNNSSRAPHFFVEKLAAMGIETDEKSIVTSATATAHHLTRHFPPNPRVFVVGERGIAEILSAAGAQILENDAQNADVVVAGIDRAFNYEKLRMAQQLILRGAKFIATNRDATFPVENGVLPGAGSIVAAIETASGQTALSMGKPQPQMLLGILESLNMSADEIAMIGDRLDTDIACGARASVGTIFVATGVTSMQEARAATGEEQPDLFFEDLRALQIAVLGAQTR